MGFWKCKDGTMVEMIFDLNTGEFIKFSDDVSEEYQKIAKEEIRKEFYGK